MSLILQILSLLFVVLWTARLARNKGRNILMWAGVAAVPALGLIPDFPDWLTVFCMFPMLALVFMPARRPVANDAAPDSAVSCPRCQHSHEPGPSFCTNCGWELTRPYATADAAADPVDAAEATAAAPAETPAETTLPPPAADPVLTSQQTAETPAALPAQPAPGEPELAPAFTATPLQITRPLTAAGMTELGLSLFSQGRVREAVDQFTKAIALDPKHRDAWANRARAYSELGLSEKAAADRQQLEGI